MSKSFREAREEITGDSWLDDLARESLSAAEEKFGNGAALAAAEADYDDLPPVQYLVMEVLAARARLGERYWTFPVRLRPALNALRERGLIWWRSAPTPGDVQAYLTETGRSVGPARRLQQPGRAGWLLVSLRRVLAHLCDDRGQG